jgi:hypothetical protein
MRPLGMVVDRHFVHDAMLQPRGLLRLTRPDRPWACRNTTGSRHGSTLSKAPWRRHSAAMAAILPAMQGWWTISDRVRTGSPLLRLSRTRLPSLVGVGTGAGQAEGRTQDQDEPDLAA